MSLARGLLSSSCQRLSQSLLSSPFSSGAAFAQTARLPTASISVRGSVRGSQQTTTIATAFASRDFDRTGSSNNAHQPSTQPSSADPFSRRSSERSNDSRWTISQAMTSFSSGSTRPGMFALGDASASVVPSRLGSRAWAAYNRALEENPMATKAIVMALGLATGDVLSQVLTAGAVTNLARSAQMAIFGLAVQGPAVHFLHKLLDKHIRPHAPTSAGAVISKVSIDQAFFAPIVIAAFISFMQISGGNASPEGVAAALHSTWAPTMQANYSLWPAALMINYGLCPPQHRVLFMNAVMVMWSVILSTTTS